MEKQGGFTRMKQYFQVFSPSIVARMLLVCLLTGFALLFPSFTPHALAATVTSVTVNANSSQGVIPATGFGINEAAWDGNLLDANLPSLLAGTGARIMRWPGGSLSDAYHWQSHTFEAGWANPNNTFDAFMPVAQKAG